MQKSSVFITVAALVITFLSGCGGPPKTNIDYGVNWGISHRIRWADTSRNLFDSYKITNKYAEKVGSEKHCVYDFEAQCSVALGPFTMDGGRVWMQRGTGATGALDDIRNVTITGSFTLTKKGNDWYCSETIR